MMEALEVRRLLSSAIAGVGNGLVGNYFSLPSLNLSFTRHDPVLDMNWTAPFAGDHLSNRTFAARWTGHVQPSHSETYTFHLLADQPAALWIDAKLVLTTGTSQELRETSGTILLRAGELHDLRLDYFNFGGGSALSLLWSSPSTSKNIVPQSQLYADAGWVTGGWLDATVGNPAQPGHTLQNASAFVVTGAGSAIGGARDQFHYFYRTLNGDGTIRARIENLPSAGGKTGVMFRESLDAESSFAGLLITTEGARLEYRTSDGLAFVSPAVPFDAPGHVKLVRDGDFLKAYVSTSGIDNTWMLAGTAFVNMSRTTHAGLALASGSSSTATEARFSEPQVTPLVPLGAGLDQVKDWSVGNVFVDVAMQMRTYMTPAFTGTVPVDERGYPTADFSTIFITGAANTARIYNGVYRLSFSGQAELGTWVSPIQIRNQVYNPSTNTTTAEVVVNASDASSTWYLGISFTNTRRTFGGPTSSGITNIRVIRPDYSPRSSVPFTSEYLAHLAQFTTLRFMDFTATNNSTVTHWSDRARPDDARQSSARGVAWEYVVQMANLLGKDIWINVPVRATDDYVRELATLLRENLRPDIAIYVEYSNEVWNGSFSQFHDNLAAARAEVNAGNSPLNNDGSTNEFYWAWRRVAKRTKEIGDVFASVFGADAHNTRVRPVLAGQWANTEVLRQGLDFIERTYGSAGEFFYGIAVAPYFGFNSLDKSSNSLAVDQILAQMRVSVDNNTASYHRYVAMAQRYSLRTMAYEGGPDTFGPNNIAAKKAASLDPRMQDLVRHYLQGWYSQGGGLFSWFIAGPTNWDTQFGTWGLTDAIDNLEAPKILGTYDVVTSPKAPLVGGIPVPATIDARHRAGTNPPYVDPHLRSSGRGTSFDYLVRVPRSGHYQLTLVGATTGTNEQLRVNVNTSVHTITLRSMETNTSWADNPVGNVYLEQGINLIRLTSVNEVAGWNLLSLRIAPAATSSAGAPFVANPASASPTTTTARSVALSILGGHERGESNLTYSWQAVGESALAVSFSANGTNDAKNTVATFSRSGTFRLECTISDGVRSVTSTVVVTVAQEISSMTLTPASTIIAPGMTQQFTARAFDQFGFAMFTQPASAWSITSGPGTISSTGLYTAPADQLGQATVRAAIAGFSATSTVTLQPYREPENPINAIAGLEYTYYEGSWSVLPNFDTLVPIKRGVVSSFSLANREVDDHFGFVFRGFITVPADGVYTFFTTSDDGSRLYIGDTLVVDNDGRHAAQERSGQILLRAGAHALSVLYFEATGAEVLTVRYSGPGISKQVIPAFALTHVRRPPAIVQSPRIEPATIKTTAGVLSVLGIDEGGESNITYTWATTSKPASTPDPVFSVNGDNAAKNTTVSFFRAGTYTLRVTLSAGGLQTVATLNVAVEQTLTSMTVMPASVTLTGGQTQQFAISAFDQFAHPMNMAVPVIWSLELGGSGGTISSTGLYTAPTSGIIDDVVVATSGSLSATAVVNATAVTGNLFSTSMDIGGPALAGSFSIVDAKYTVRGGGADIWGHTDQFHYVYRSFDGDGEIIARVTSVDNTHPRAKSGIMFRETLTAKSKHAMLVLSPDDSISFQRRPNTGGGMISTRVAGTSAPQWLRLVRTGSTIDAYRSTDGANWIHIGYTIVSMAPNIYVGLAVSSHDDAVLNTSTFDNVRIVQK